MISVIIPVFNLENCIARTLDSVLGQSCPELEIIAVNDGSSDGSTQILDAYAQQYPQKLRVIHKENGGVTSARLAGVRQARGEWIGFVDGDDEIESDMYEFLLNNALQYRADISHCGYQMVFPDGRVNRFYGTGRRVQQNTAAGLTDLLDGAFVEPGLCNKLYSRRLFDAVLRDGRMPLDIRINEDLLMNFYLFSQAEHSVFEDRCKYRYLVRPTSASRQKMNAHKIYDPVRVRRIILDEADGTVREAAQRAYLTACVYTYCALGRRQYRCDRQCLRSHIREHRQWIALLPGRTALLARMIADAPVLFAAAYPVYQKLLQKKKYD